LKAMIGKIARKYFSDSFSLCVEKLFAVTEKGCIKLIRKN